MGGNNMAEQKGKAGWWIAGMTAVIAIALGVLLLAGAGAKAKIKTIIKNCSILIVPLPTGGHQYIATGYLYDANNNPLRKIVKFQADYGIGYNTLQSQTTDATGKFAFSYVEIGVVSLEALRVIFEGDNEYEPSECTKVIT
jgi:hypothetical protein